MLLDRSKRGEIGTNELGEFRMISTCRASANGNHSSHPAIAQAFAQHALTDHSGRTKQDHVHGFLFPVRSDIDGKYSVRDGACVSNLPAHS